MGATATDIKALKYSLDGSPWCNVVAKSSINADTLEYSKDGSPWWGHKLQRLWNLFIGSNRVDKMFIGSNEVDAAYVGSVQL